MTMWDNKLMKENELSKPAQLLVGASLTMLTGFAAVVGVEGRVKLVRPMDPAPIDDHHHLFLGVPEGCHHLREILAQLLGIKVRHDLREDF